MITKNAILSLLRSAHQWLEMDKEKNSNASNEVYIGAHKALEALEHAVSFRLIDKERL